MSKTPEQLKSAKQNQESRTKFRVQSKLKNPEQVPETRKTPET